MIYKLSEIISPAFSDVHKKLKSGEINQLVLKGGRGSGKSSYASVEGILQIIQNPKIHGVVLRKVSNTLRTSVYAQYIWAIIALGLYDKFKCTVSPMELTYKETGQKIMFFGSDDPGKLKSIKTSFGYIGFLHFEEVDQFEAEDEIRNIEQSILRGGEIAIEIKTFNPPKTNDNWANKYCVTNSNKPGQIIHHSTYLTTPKEWLGDRWIDEAEYLKEINPKAYEHEYLGVANGSGGMVFTNIIDQNISDDEIKHFDRIYTGVDWGWEDPWAFTRSYYNASQRILYIFDEAREHHMTTRQTAEIVKNKINKGDIITCDSSPKENTADYQERGLNARRAKKGPGSVDRSYQWLQGLTSIVIDRRRCPYTFDEFSNYEYDKSKNGEIITSYPDRNNHQIDSVRYACEQLWAYREKPLSINKIIGL